MRDYGLFGSQSMMWHIGREAIVTLGGTRAVLMQIAHPLVAAGVIDHSRYLQDPFGRALSTFLLGQMLTFGSTGKAYTAAKTINHLHQHVQGTLPIQAGCYAPGTSYDARDPALLLWVYATLIDTILLTYPLCIGPLSQIEQETYYQESKKFVRLLGLSEKYVPENVHALQAYVQAMTYSDQLAATPQSRQLAQAVLFPPATRLLRPAMHLNLHVTSALLAPPIRELFDLPWSANRQYIFNLSTSALRTIIPALPPLLRTLPITHTLMRGEHIID